MNLLNLIRANREPSLLTGTTKEFVTGSKNNLISWATHLTCVNLPYLILYRPHNVSMGKCTTVIDGLELNYTSGTRFYLLYILRWHQETSVKCVPTGKHQTHPLEGDFQQNDLTPYTLKKRHINDYKYKKNLLSLSLSGNNSWNKLPEGFCRLIDV